MSLLQSHKKTKERKVSAWDYLSVGLGLGGTLMIFTSFFNPKAQANAIRIPAAIVLFGASVAAERLRESDLISLDRATEYEDNLKSDRIRRNTVMHETLLEVEEAENFFAQLPRDRWELAAQRVGIAPPNYQARQPDPMLQQIQSPSPAQTQTATLPDPTGDFDPEKGSLTDQQSSGAMFIPKAKVEEWFEALGSDLPSSLLEEWRSSPGRGIEVIDGDARIVP